MRKLKKRPSFRSERAEAEFWSTHDSTEYVDYSKAKRALFPNLEPSTETISLRPPKSLLHHVKTSANKRDVPYQTLLKLFLAERVQEELKEGTAKASR
jgi:predicted DNA binding CopG/RHH family protein